MKNQMSFLVILLILLFSASCQPDKSKDKDTKMDILQYRVLGLAYLEEDRLDEAEMAFSKLIELSPREAMGYANLGLVYLRKGDFSAAKKQLEIAIKRDKNNADIRLIRAKYLEITNDREKAIEELKISIEIAPDHAKSYYTLAEMYTLSEQPESNQLIENYLSKLVEIEPGNIVPQLKLAEIFLKSERADQATEILESLTQKFPEFPQEADEYYQKTLDLLHANDPGEALNSLIVFHNYMKVTSQYQADLRNIKGPEGRLIGLPVITFSDVIMSQFQEGESVLESISFSDVTDMVFLDLSSPVQDQSSDELIPSHISLADYDGDGYQDLYYGSADGSGKLYKNGFGFSFTDYTAEAGLRPDGEQRASIFVDYNNDGKLDLYVVRSGPDFFYHNEGEGRFKEVGRETQVDDEDEGNKALFMDVDHEGDLDLFILKPSFNQLMRNNSDGTFTDQSESMSLAGQDLNSPDATFADFDEDGDLDIFVVNKNGPNMLHSNIRHGKFDDVTEASGLSTSANSIAVEVVDYNNDGFSDLFTLPANGGRYELWQNKGNGTFERINPPWMESLNQINGLDAKFFDFDNNGFLDLMVIGTPIAQRRGAILLHNDGNGRYKEVTHLLSESLQSGRQVEVGDYDKDGDLDIYTVDLSGRIRLFQNDGGNINRYLNVQLVGLRTGSGKNNHFGIGAKVEVRAGDLYQMKTINEPTAHFGLGARLKADVVRILWTNGVPQNIFFPGTDQDLIEAQMLKGSCAFLYTWNGSQYEFVKDMMWRSALGMPTGIMGGNTAYAFPHASKEFLNIPSEIFKPRDGIYTIQVTEELWESAYFDQAEIIALDRPQEYDLYVDERFTPPPYPDLHVFAIKEKISPRLVTDEHANDLLPKVLHKDDDYISNFKSDAFQGLTKEHALIIDPGKDLDDSNLTLFLNGWLFPTDASINTSIAQGDMVQVQSPSLQVKNESGDWITVINDIGFPMGKDKMVIVDLTDQFLSKDRTVRINTNMEIYWDHIFFAYPHKNIPLQSTVMKPHSADLHYRGFSKLYRKGGRYGPHWFDYQNVDTKQKWRDLIGKYTRFGDVLPLLMEADDQYVIMNAGDEITITFDEKDLPLLKSGWKRDFVIFSEGWIKDGDLNTAHGKTIDPLPFHGMSKYPYGNDESYPSDPEYQEYMETYNTREVTTESFRREIMDYEGRHE